MKSCSTFDLETQKTSPAFGLVFLDDLVMPRAPEVLVSTTPDVTMVMMMTAAEPCAESQHGGAGGGLGFVCDVGRLCGHGKGCHQGDDEHSSGDGGGATIVSERFHLGLVWVEWLQLKD
jgi:hypothetical protein